MMTINRTVVFVTPKQPYLDWASSFDDDRPLSLDEKIFSTAYLIPDTYDELNYGKWLKRNFKDIFVQELESWMTDSDEWPMITYQIFAEWFEVRVADALIDLGNKPIMMEEY